MSAQASRRREIDEVLVGFAHAVRVAGVGVTADRTRQFMSAASLLGLTPDGISHAANATLCSRPEDCATVSQVFDLYFRDDLLLVPHCAPEQAAGNHPLAVGDSDFAMRDAVDDVVPQRAVDVEVLRHRDVADLSLDERAHLNRLLLTLQPHPPRRRRVRKVPRSRGSIDFSRTARATIKQMGEPTPLRWRDRMERPRPMVLLIDVSGSMKSYADVLVRVAHLMTRRLPGPVETFTMATRVTRVTQGLTLANPDDAITAVAHTVPDWASGTRLGENLRAFLVGKGSLARTRGAVVVVFSDGWESGDTDLLADQMRHLHRVAHRVFWVNPHRGKLGYEPIQRGIVAVLPHVDALLAGHSLATFEAMLTEVERA